MTVSKTYGPLTIILCYDYSSQPKEPTPMSFAAKIQDQVKANRQLLIKLPYEIEFVNEWVPETLSYKMAIHWGTRKSHTAPERQAAPWNS